MTRQKRRWRNEALFNKSKNMETLHLAFLYTLVIVLDASYEALAALSNEREALKMVLACVLLEF